jgi:hypothetical protein
VEKHVCSSAALGHNSVWSRMNLHQRLGALKHGSAQWDEWNDVCVPDGSAANIEPYCVISPECVCCSSMERKEFCSVFEGMLKTLEGFSLISYGYG